MTYFVSDIHGEYDLFRQLLDKIRFSDGDEMYIVGDMIDKGSKSVKLVDFVRAAPNIKAILGNHEFEFLQYYYGLMRTAENANDIEQVLCGLQEHFPYKTEKLSWETVDFIESLPFFVETDDFICVHAGVRTDENDVILPMDRQIAQVMVFDRDFKSPSFALSPKNKTVLFGHTPCSFDNGDGKFLKTPKSGVATPSKLTDYAKIRLDNGVYQTGMLGALCLETMQEIYVKKQP